MYAPPLATLLTLRILDTMQGVKFSSAMKYGLKLDNPKEFYAEVHRPTHFLEFSGLEDAGPVADVENPFA